MKCTGFHIVSFEIDEVKRRERGREEETIEVETIEEREREPTLIIYHRIGHFRMPYFKKCVA